MMTDLQDKIARFENMTAADPSNDMAHFSLGTAYLEAQKYQEAILSFEASIALNPDMTRAMELCGSAYMQMGNVEEAKKILIDGFTQAASRGEMKVREGITAILKAAGLEIPEVDGEVAVKEGQPLDEPPLPGAIGEWIFENVTADMWNVWIGQGTKVINELRLDFSKEEDQKSYEDYMVEFLGIPSEVVEQDRKADS